ncbi:hypothetical protein HII36_36655 [Nonomuraea sp. NN258]|uniref:hypothetical protein n=1 Tax=Nonomuraea antri TaxID=2730852 RepID=UPI001568AD32|nr:hypothetical protein [Nonomuraea antri]NRQ37328.1 hypothetical protein [Nonomuraea antri]
MSDDPEQHDDPAPDAADDPRHEPAPFATTVLLTGGSAVAVMGIAALLSHPPGLKFLLFGPIALVAFEVITAEVWWKRWWGALPGAAISLACYFEGRQALADALGDTWAHPVAYVLAWTLFATVFALCSRYPRPLQPSG